VVAGGVGNSDVCHLRTMSGRPSPAQCAVPAKYAHLPAGVLPVKLHNCSMGKRVAVLGGSFDPITNGHLVSACEIIHASKADEVWIVPCGVRPDKPSLRTPYRQRLVMCQMAVDVTFGSSFPVRVCDVEMLEDCALNCYDLMHRLMEEYPDKEFSFVIGSDLYETLKDWDEGDRLEWLLNECRWLVFDRPGFTMPDHLSSNFTIVNPMKGCTLASQELSSSEIRRRIKIDMSMVDGLVPPAVLAHIKRYRVYDTAVAGQP